MVAASPPTYLLLFLLCKLSGAGRFLPQISEHRQNETDASSQRSWVLEAFEAGLPFGIAMVYNKDEGSDVFKERPELFKSYAGAEEEGFSNSTREGVERAISSTKWISVIRKDVPAALFENYGVFGFLFSLDRLWPHVVKGTMSHLDGGTQGLSKGELTDEGHPSKSNVYGKRGNPTEAQVEFEVDLQGLLKKIFGSGGLLITGRASANEFRVLGDKLPADAFVGVVLCARKIMKDAISFQKLEAEKIRMMSEFRRLTGRADAPVFGYVAIPASEWCNKYPNTLLSYDWFLRDMISVHLGDTGLAAGGSVLWQVPDQTNSDRFLCQMISEASKHEKHAAARHWAGIHDWLAS